MPGKGAFDDVSEPNTIAEQYVDKNGIPYIVHRPPFQCTTLDHVFHSFIHTIVSDPELVTLGNKTCTKYVNGENVPNGPSLELTYKSAGLRKKGGVLC